MARNDALERRIKAYKLGWNDMSADEKRALTRALNGAVDPSLVIGIVLARSRTLRRQGSDRVCDPERRVLVGARVPRAFHSRCKTCAETSKKSLYRFVFDALMRECDEVERMLNVEKPVENSGEGR